MVGGSKDPVGELSVFSGEKSWKEIDLRLLVSIFLVDGLGYHRPAVYRGMRRSSFSSKNFKFLASSRLSSHLCTALQDHWVYIQPSMCIYFKMCWMSWCWYSTMCVHDTIDDWAFTHAPLKDSPTYKPSNVDYLLAVNHAKKMIRCL